MPNTQTQTMTDKDYLTEFLDTQKQITANYNQFAGECVNTELRSSLLTMLNEEHDIQSDIFNQMHARGWYQVKGADPTELTTVKTKFPS